MAIISAQTGLTISPMMKSGSHVCISEVVNVFSVEQSGLLVVCVWGQVLQRIPRIMHTVLGFVMFCCGG